MEFIPSKRGRPRLIDNNFIFIIESENEEKKIIRWKCPEYQNYSCRVRLTMVDNQITSRGKVKDHTHATDVGKIEAEKIVHTLREAAISSRNNPRYSHILS